jgi:hypothetical protein
MPFSLLGTSQSSPGEAALDYVHRGKGRKISMAMAPLVDVKLR